MNATDRGDKTTSWFPWLLLAGLIWAIVLLNLTPEGHEMLSAAGDRWTAIQQYFQVVNTSTPLLRILSPALCAGLVAIAIMLVQPRPTRLVRAAVIIMVASLATSYLLFRTFATLNLGSTAETTFSLLFLAAEFTIYVKSMSAYAQMFWPSDRTPQADRLMKDVLRGSYGPSVDIFVPTYNEPVEILRRTILGCQSLEYRHKLIYLLDDQRRPEMRALARELGCHYRDRPDNRDAKAGNMNAALPSTNGELIAVFDADFIPTTDFLLRTVGFFQDAQVGLVQTPQNFYSVDAVSRNLGLPGVLTEEQQVFFRSAQPGRDTLGAMICHGTSFVIRRSAVLQIGGFPGETLSEDWATSIKLQAAGWHTYYLNELLSAGAAAEFTSEFVTQRLRWARGTLQCFYASTNPLTVPGLNWRQRLVHLCGPLHYVQYLCRLFCLLLPLLYLCFGIVPIRVSGELLLVYFLPYWLCQTLTVSWLTGGHRSAFWSEVYETLLCVPMTLTVLSTLIRPFGKPFKVSSKGQTRNKLTFNPMVGGPLVLMLGVYVVAVGYAIANAEWYPSKSIFSLAVGWSAYSMVLLWLALQASLDVPQKTSVLRFRLDLRAAIFVNGEPHGVTVEALSDEDAIITAPAQPSGAAAACALHLTLPIDGLGSLPITDVEADGPSHWRVKWPRLAQDRHRKLVAFLYCRPGQWEKGGVSEPITFWHFLQAPFRMYPLAEGGIQEEAAPAAAVR